MRKKHYPIISINKFYLCHLELNALNIRTVGQAPRKNASTNKFDSNSPTLLIPTVITCNGKSLPGKMVIIFFLDIFGFAIAILFFSNKM